MSTLLPETGASNDGCVETLSRSCSRLCFSFCFFFSFGQIKRQLDKRARIALHGTNGFPPDLMRQCIRAGATKINVNRIVLDDYYAHLRAEAAGMKSHTALLEEGVSKVVDQTVGWMEIVGSAGRAPAPLAGQVSVHDSRKYWGR